MTTAQAPGAEVVHFKMSSALDAVTRMVTDDEPCFVLTELNLPSRTGRTLSRFQILRIVRQDRLVTAYVYLGPASKFAADQLVVPGGEVVNGKGRAWHTVAECQEIADHFRILPPRREQQPSDMQGAFRNMVEEKKRRRLHQSNYGYGGQKTRP